jgi:hypothetical protein
MHDFKNEVKAIVRAMAKNVYSFSLLFYSEKLIVSIDCNSLYFQVFEIKSHIV